MQAVNKKEVSCKALLAIFKAVEAKRLDEKIISNGIQYSLDYLKDTNQRIEWSDWCKIISNLRPYFTSEEFESMGTYLIRSGNYIIGIFVAYFLFSTNRFSRMFNKQIFKMAESTFSCVHQYTEYLDKNRIRVNCKLDDGYEFCPEFWYMSRGVWIESAKNIGRRGVVINLSFANQKVAFDVSWNKETILFRVKRGLSWVFNIKRAFIELNDSHQELLSQYLALDQSKKLLQKQTTQLKTAYKISTSVRQSTNIFETLKAITDTLVDEAGFDAAFIQLEKDLDDNEIDIKSQTGKILKLNRPICQEIVINNEKIGEYLLNPISNSDDDENRELIEYLKPVVNIAIHNALTLREVSNYKDNLQQMVTDRTNELQKARDELAKTNELLSHANQAQSNFFTNISHEFRTPLTLILGPAKQLSEQLIDEAAKTKADLIHRSAKNLNRLVDELLDISKIEAGEMNLKACPLNLVKVVKESALSFSSLAERRKITFNINSTVDELITYVDRNKVDKILSNVLSNAFKFTPEGGSVDIEIQINPEFISGSQSVSATSDNIKIPKLVRDDGFVEISIRDTGIGIPENQIDKIFDRFYQVDGSHTREHEGTGIGLALTKELVELHKGRIEVESKEGKGSKFKIIFQLGKNHLRPEDICEELCAEDIVTPEPEKTNETKDFHKLEIELSEKPSLLIVEDNPDVRNYISMILGNEYRIFESKDGEEGLDKAFECIPDLIISDVMMPKMDGFQLCRHLKTDLRTSHIPVIMLTAKATMQDKIDGLEIGADEYIMKPFDAEELRARIKNLLEQRKRLHEHFNKYGFVDTERKNITSADQKFLTKVVSIIDENISDTSFGVEVLAEKLAVSHSLLYKKINSLTGTSPSELIKKLRLNRAAKLIESNTGNISEIALEVGFNNPAYFADCFKKQFGVAPSQYHKM